MKKQILICTLFLFTFSYASNASDWYKPDLEYYKITTKHNNISKISVDTLLKLNPLLKGLNSDGFLLFYRGELYPFYYCFDDTIKEGDYILFLGKHAGTDTSYKNEWTDESVFYLCYDGSIIDAVPEDSRLSLYNEPGGYVDTIKGVYVSQHFEKDSIYYAGIDGTYYDKSRFEGWYWHKLKDYPGGQDNISTLLHNGRLRIDVPFYPVNDTIEVLAKVSTADSFATSKRKLNMVLNSDTIMSVSFDTLGEFVIKKKVEANDFIEGLNALEIINLTNGNSKSAYLGVDYFEINGMSKPFAYRHNDGMMSSFEVIGQPNNSLLQIDAWIDSNIIILDTVSKSILFKLTNNNTLRFNVSAHTESKHYFIINDWSSVEIAKISNTKKTNYKNDINSADVILIYNKKFETKSLEYSEYRSNQGYKVFNADVEEIYKEFNYGSKSPNAIKTFLKFAYENWTQPIPKYVILIGDASTDSRQCNPESKAVDYIPTYGNPPSDYWYGAFNLYDPEHKSEMIIGRIPISNDVMLENYLTKLKNYENQNTAKWNKKFLFVNGGKDSAEKSDFRLNSMYMGQLLDFKPLCADTAMISRDYDDSTSTITFAKKDEIINAINNGTMFTIFTGHGAVNYFDMGGWDVSYLNNNDKYGILATFSCNTGDFATTGTAMMINEEYIMKHSDKGYIAAIGATTPTVMVANGDLLQRFIEAMTNENKRCIGDLLEYAKRKLNYYDGSKWTNIMRFNFGILGDPLIKVKIDTVPDFYINANEVKISSTEGNSTISENTDSIFVEYYVGNAGTAHDGNYSIGVHHYWNGELINEFHNIEYNLCKGEYFNFSAYIRSMPGEHLITINIDEYEQTNENNKSNNLCTLKINVHKLSLLAVEPLPDWTVNTHNPIFRFISPSGNITMFEYEFQILAIDDNDTTLIKTSEITEIQKKENCIDWFSQVELPVGNYILKAKTNTNDVSISMQELILPFNTFIENYDTTTATAELATISSKCFFSSDTTMRGDTLIFSFIVENLSMRKKSVVTPLLVQIWKPIANSFDTFFVSLPPIKKNDSIKIEIPINTKYSEYTNLINVTIDTANINNELYTFNNSYQNNFYVNEDKIKPTLIINFDSTATKNKDYISQSPLIEVELQDNSNLPVTADNPIMIKINASPQSRDNTILYELDVDYKEGSTTKAKLTILPNLLEENENYFNFTGIDASGNEINENFYLYVSLNNSVDNQLTFPNPVTSSDDFLNFKFYFKSSLTDAIAEIKIYSTEGKFINSINQLLKIRDNYILWNMRDYTGKLIPTGIYFYEIKVNSEYWTAPSFGKFIFINE